MSNGTQEEQPHVVIVGGGFGGLNAAKALKRVPVRITLIDRANHHLFQPLLYQVATAGLSPADIASPIRSVLRRQTNATVLLADVIGVNLEKRLLRLAKSELPYVDVPYDFLILATGATTAYYGNDQWAPYAIGLKNIEDALEVRRRVLLAFEAAEREPDVERRRRLLTFVIIGAGPTGVELAGALAELSRFVLARDFRFINPKASRIVLLEGGDRILPSFSEGVAAKGKAHLERLGCQINTHSMVTDINTQGVYIGDEFIPSATVLWAAGVRGTALTKTLGVPLDRASRVQVEPDCSLPGHPEAFAIGDMTAFTHDADGGGGPLPGVAPVAMQQGRFVAKAIAATLAGRERTTFEYVDKGNLATIGRRAAVAEVGPFKVAGAVAWLLWLVVHIMYLIGFRNRLVVLVQWIWNYLTYQRGARLITGNRLSPGPPGEWSGRAARRRRTGRLEPLPEDQPKTADRGQAESDEAADAEGADTEGSTSGTRS